MLHSIGMTDPTINYAPFTPYPNTSTLPTNGINQADTNLNPMLGTLPRSTHGIGPATPVAMAAAAAAASAGISPNVKDSRWLTLEVCRQYQRNQCSRDESECKFAHPPTHVDVQSGRVVCCYDSIKGKCQRRDPPCKYLHPPQHLKEQLIQNGRNNMIMRNMQFQLLTQQYLAQGGLVPLGAAAAVAAVGGNPNGPNTNPTGPTGTSSNSLLYGTPALTLGAPGAPSPYQVLPTTNMNNRIKTSNPMIDFLIPVSNQSIPNLTDHLINSIQKTNGDHKLPTKFRLIDLLGRFSHDLDQSNGLPVSTLTTGSTVINTAKSVSHGFETQHPVPDPIDSGRSRKRSYDVIKNGSEIICNPEPALLLITQLGQQQTMGFSPYLSPSGLASFHGVGGPPTLNESNGHLGPPPQPMRSTLSAAELKSGGMNLYTPSAAAAAVATLAHLNGLSASKQQQQQQQQQENGDSLNGCVMLMNGTSMDSLKSKELNGTGHTNGSLNSISNGHSSATGVSQPGSQQLNNMHSGTNGSNNNTANSSSANNNNLAVVASLIGWQQTGTPLAIPHPGSLTADSLAAAVAAVTGGASGPAGVPNGVIGPTNDLTSHYQTLPDHSAYFQPAYHIEIPPFPFQ